MDTQVFAINALGWKSIGALVLMALAVVASVILGMDKGFRAVPVGLAIVVFGVVLALLGSVRILVTDGNLVAGGVFYKVKVPLAQIDAGNVRLLPADDPFRLRWRTNGLGWPGLSLGWFTTNGSKRVFAAITGKRNRVYIPTSGGFDIVLTPEDPAGLIAAIERR